ncbi:MAG: hypothetical protein JWQ24_2718 [Tardiphaga sp.]|nr:hypothetical protein [Tardiphaga sp.]
MCNLERLIIGLGVGAGVSAAVAGLQMLHFLAS